MNIAGIDYESVKDGDGVRTTIYVSGCSHNCYNCHNPQTHDINYGVPFTEKLQNEIIENIKKRPFISGITWSGGDPLHENCLDDVLKFTNRIRLSLPNKTIWLYTGYTLHTCKYFDEDIFTFNPHYYHPNPLNGKPLEVDDKSFLIKQDRKRVEIVKSIDVLVDGRYIDSQRNLSAKWRGSDNQRCIDIQESLMQSKVILYCD